MSTTLFTAAVAVALTSLSVASIACTADIHDNTFNVDASLDFETDVDVNHVQPGDSIAVTMNATGVVLVEPEMEPAEKDAAVAAHFEIYLDDTESTPLLITAQASAQVTIPATTSEGKHKVICRMHKHDGTPTTYQKNINITVTASASVSTGDAG